jgi:hypothetical protein
MFNRVILWRTDAGPSIARVLGLEDKQVLQSSEGWMPVAHGEGGNLAGLNDMFSRSTS